PVRVALEEAARHGDARLVGRARAAGGAGGEAAAELAAQAAGLVVSIEQFDLVGEADGDGGRAVAQFEQVGQFAQRLAYALPAAERAEVDASFVCDLPDEHELGRGPGRDAHEAVRAVPLVLDVVDRPPALDLLELAQHCGELAGRVVPRDRVRVRHDLGRLLAALGTEVGEQPRAHAHGLPDVQHLAGRPEHAVHAGPVLGARAHVFAQLLQTRRDASAAHMLTP